MTQATMKGYLTPEQGGAGAVPIESQAEVYRDPDSGQEVTVATDGSESSLGVADVTVSRKKNGTAPVVLKPESECIEVRNRGNTNGVVVRTDGDHKELQEGFSARLRRDAVLQIGHQTKLRLTIEREAREEYVIGGDVDADGDVVMGEQRNVDQRTTVEDVVAKEIEVDGDSPAEVRDTVANDMRVGANGDDESPTQNVCEDHGTYTGQVCPKCESTDDASSEGDSKYCIFCGDTVPTSAQACPECGKEFPTSES
jgi:hypothetical protein